MTEQKAIKRLSILGLAAAVPLALLVLQLVSSGGSFYLDAQGTPIYVPNAAPALQLTGTNGAGRLQAALNSLTTAGGTIRLTATYTESPTTAITVTKNNVKILCDPGATITSNGALQILNISGNNAEVAYCTFAGSTQQTIQTTGAAPYIHDNTITSGGATNPGSGTAAAIDLESSNSDARVERNTITGTGNTAGAVNNGVDIVANYSTNASNNGTFRLHIIGNHISGSAGSAFGVMLFNVSDSEARQNVIDGNNKLAAAGASGYGIMCYNTNVATGPAARNVVSGNNIANTAGTGIYMQGCPYSVVENNILTNTAQQQLDTSLTVGAIGINAGNASSLSAPGTVVVGNTIHTSGLQGIDVAHAPGIVIASNSMDGVTKYGIWLRGPGGAAATNNPTIVGNNITAANAGMNILGVTGGIIKGNYVSGFSTEAINTDSASSNLQIEGNSITGNTGDQYAVFISSPKTIIQGNNFFGLATISTGENALRLSAANLVVRNNVFQNTTINLEILLTSAATTNLVEMNWISRTSGGTQAIVEQAGATNNVYRRNVISGGTSPGWSFGGTTPIHYENSYNGAIEAFQVSSLTIGANTVLPATLTGTQGNGVNLATATGAFTSGNLRSTNAGLAEADSGLAANTLITKVSTCGATTTCSGSIATAPRVLYGNVALTTGAATVASMPAWSSTASWTCSCSDQSSITSSCHAAPASTTSLNLTGNGSDLVVYICVGN